MTRYSQDIVLGSYHQTVAPSSTALAVTRDEAKLFLRLIDNDELDPEIDRLIRASTEQVERDSRRVIMTQTWRLVRDDFPCHSIELRRVPVQSVTHIKYLSGGTQTTLSASLYETDLYSEPARIQPVYGQVWPTTDCAINAVEVEFIAGYASAAVVPNYLKSVILAVVKMNYRGCPAGSEYWDMITKLQTFGAIA